MINFYELYWDQLQILHFHVIICILVKQIFRNHYMCVYLSSNKNKKANRKEYLVDMITNF